MILLQFVSERAFTSEVIGWFSSGHLSHVDAILPDGSLLGARSDRVGGRPAGVQIRPSGYLPFDRKVIFKLPATPRQENLWKSFLLGQLGKPYDKKAIWAFAFGRDWREQDSWICSELQMAALEACGVSPSLYLTANKITPVAAALVASALGGKLQ